MAIQIGSVLLGAGAMLLLPSAARLLRPLLVEVMAAGMSVAEEASRVVAEQVEVLEDIAAEARARREAPSTGALAAEDPETAEPAPNHDGDEGIARPRARRGGRRPS